MLTALLMLFSTPTMAQVADLVLRNGVIWTVDDDNPRAQAMASAGDRILYVGSDAGVEQYIGDSTEVVDLAGNFVTPGFYDNHVHFESTGLLLYGLNLLDVSDEKSFVDRIRAVNNRYSPGTWILGGDWSAYETWAESDVSEAGRKVNPDDLYGNLFLPNKGMVDGFTSDRPVLVRRFDRKVYMANTAALEMAGIRTGTVDPEGIAVERNENGDLLAHFSILSPVQWNPQYWYGITSVRCSPRLFQRRHEYNGLQRHARRGRRWLASA